MFKISVKFHEIRWFCPPPKFENFRNNNLNIFKSIFKNSLKWISAEILRNSVISAMSEIFWQTKFKTLLLPPGPGGSGAAGAPCSAARKISGGRDDAPSSLHYSSHQLLLPLAASACAGARTSSSAWTHGLLLQVLRSPLLIFAGESLADAQPLIVMRPWDLICIECMLCFGQ